MTLRNRIKPEMEKKGGRVILHGRLYHKMRAELCNLANSRCERCGVYTPLAEGEADHLRGRGAGKRDDRIFVEGARNLEWSCRGCHGKRHDGPKPVPKKPLTDAEFKELLGL